MYRIHVCRAENYEIIRKDNRKLPIMVIRQMETIKMVQFFFIDFLTSYDLFCPHSKQNFDFTNEYSTCLHFVKHAHRIKRTKPHIYFVK